MPLPLCVSLARDWQKASIQTISSDFHWSPSGGAAHGGLAPLPDEQRAVQSGGCQREHFALDHAHHMPRLAFLPLHACSYPSLGWKFFRAGIPSMKLWPGQRGGATWLGFSQTDSDEGKGAPMSGDVTGYRGQGMEGRALRRGMMPSGVIKTELHQWGPMTEHARYHFAPTGQTPDVWKTIEGNFQKSCKKS